MKHKIYLASVIAAIYLISIVSAAGVSVPYWDTPGNENPLYLPIGETKDINLELQNMVGGEPITFMVSVVSQGNVATLATTQTEYQLAAGERKNVALHIVSPQGAHIGDKYKVTFTAKENKASAPGQFAFGSAFETSFEVIISEKPVSQSPSGLFGGNNTIIYALILIIVVVAFVAWIKKKKN